MKAVDTPLVNKDDESLINNFATNPANRPALAEQMLGIIHHIDESLNSTKRWNEIVDLAKKNLHPAKGISQEQINSLFNKVSKAGGLEKLLPIAKNELSIMLQRRNGGIHTDIGTGGCGVLIAMAIACMEFSPTFFIGVGCGIAAASAGCLDR